MQISASTGGGSRFAQYTPHAQQHATAKFFGVPHVAALEGVRLLSLFGVAGVIELAGGTLLLIGLWTRPAAFLLSGEMAVAYFLVHAAQGSFLSPILNGGEPAVLFCFIFLLFAAAGAGAWSVDGMRGRTQARWR